MQFRGGVETGLKPIVGNPTTQVVHVVQPDISGKPLQDGWELEV
jgi:hypothetical protein